MPKSKSANKKKIVKLHCWTCGFVFTKELEDGWAIGRAGDQGDRMNENRREGLLLGQDLGAGHNVTDLVCPNCHDIYKIQRFTKKEAVSEAKVALNEMLRKWQDGLDRKDDTGKSPMRDWHESLSEANRNAWRRTGVPLLGFDIDRLVVFDVRLGPSGDPRPITMPYIDYAVPRVYQTMKGGSHYHNRFELEYAPWTTSYCFVDAHRTLEELLAAIFPHYGEVTLSFIVRKSIQEINKKIDEIVNRRKALLPDISGLVSELRYIITSGKAYSEVNRVMTELNTLARQWTFRPPDPTAGIR